jgi:hypothetical protein
METEREEIDPFEDIDDPTLRVQMEHEMMMKSVYYHTKFYGLF